MPSRNKVCHTLFFFFVVLRENFLQASKVHDGSLMNTSKWDNLHQEIKSSYYSPPLAQNHDGKEPVRGHGMNRGHKRHTEETISGSGNCAEKRRWWQRQMSWEVSIQKIQILRGSQLETISHSSREQSLPEWRQLYRRPLPWCAEFIEKHRKTAPSIVMNRKPYCTPKKWLKTNWGQC